MDLFDVLMARSRKRPERRKPSDEFVVSFCVACKGGDLEAVQQCHDEECFFYCMRPGKNRFQELLGIPKRKKRCGTSS